MQNYRQKYNCEGIRYAPDNYENSGHPNTSIEYCNPLMKQVVKMDYDSKD